MPAQLTHIAYAAAYLQRHPGLDEAKFIRGTSFPDIRRIAGIKRAVTHQFGLQLADVGAEADAWQAGLMLHSYLDEAWNSFFVERGLTVRPDFDEAQWSAVKIAEESMYCGTLERREKYLQILMMPALDAELTTVPNEEMIRSWYGFIADKLARPFDSDLWRRYAAKGNYYPHGVETLLGEVADIRADAAWQEQLVELHHELGYP